MSVFPRIITHNFSLKLLALAGAVVLWAIVPGDPQGGEVISDVPVRIQVADLDWVQQGSAIPASVQVRLSGPTREIIRLARQGTVVRVPVDRVSSPDTVIALRRDWVSLAGAPGVVVEELLPGAVQVSFEEARSAAVQLDLPLYGRLPANLALAAAPAISPSVARVRGPARLVDRLSGIPLEPLDLSTVGESGIIEVAVDTTGLGGLLVSPLSASVGLRVEPAAERRLSRLPVTVLGGTGMTVLFQPDSVDVRVGGAPARLSASPMGGIRPVVDGRLLAGLAPGESRRVPLGVVGLPELVTAIPVPDSVTVVRPVGGSQ